MDESPEKVHPSVAVYVRVTSSTQKIPDRGLELLIAKTPRSVKGNFSPPIDPIIIDELSHSKKTRKGKHKRVDSSNKRQARPNVKRRASEYRDLSR